MVSVPQKDSGPPQKSSQTDSWAQVVVKGPRAIRQDEGPRERGEERGGPFDAHYNMDTTQPLGGQQSGQVSIQPTTQEVSQVTASTRDYAETEVSKDTMAMESEGTPVPGDEVEKTLGRGRIHLQGHTHSPWNGTHLITACIVTPTSTLMMSP